MPGAAPSAVPGMPGANPAAALAARAQGAPGGGGQMDMLMFLAGMGFPVFMSTMEKSKPKPPTHHKATEGMGADAARAPQQAINPQMAAMLAQRLQAQMPGGMPGGMPGMPPGMPPRGIV